MIKNYLDTLLAHKNLTIHEAKELLNLLTKEESSIRIAAILTALASKGETIEEMVGFIQGMREKKLSVTGLPGAIDVCGTGGDGSGTFNISTAVSLVTAGAGVPIIKHGNRAASSKCGSADVLEALGVTIQLTPKQSEKVLQKIGMVFLFAPFFHPSFKQVGAVRKELGIRTIFNYLGPFVNPAEVKRQLIGVPSKEVAEKLAQVGSRLGYEKLCIVTSEDGLDEISIFSKTFVYEVVGKKIKRYTIDPKTYCHSERSEESHSKNKKMLKQVQHDSNRKRSFVITQDEKIQALRGGNAKENAGIILNILQGEKSPKRDIVVLNSAAALYVAGKVKTIEHGIKLAEESIDSKRALQVLENLRKETNLYAQHA